MDGFDIQGFFQKWGVLLVIGAAVFFISYLLFGRKLGAQSSTAAATNLPGATATDSNGNPVVEYLPTTGDSYTNVNYDVNAQTNSNNVNSPQNSPVSSNNVESPVQSPTTTNTTNAPTTNTSTTTTTVTTPPAPTPPPTPNPPAPNLPPPVAQPQPQPAPTTPPPAPATRSYTIVSGDTLSGIAARVGTTWQILYNMNQGTINSWSQQHGNPIPGGPWNNIFPGEQINVPA